MRITLRACRNFHNRTNGTVSFAFLPLYTGDYRRDTQHLDCCEHGIYLLFIMHSWDSKGPVPLDERKQMGICGARSGSEIEAMRRVLSEFFVRMDDGYYNKRIQVEIERANAISLKRKSAGAKGYQAKAKHLPSKSQASASTPTTTLTPTPTTTEKTESFGLLSPSEDDDEGEVAVAKSKTHSYIAPRCPHAAIVDLFHKHFPTLSRVEILSDKRKATIGARWRQVCAEDKIASAEEGLKVFDAIFARGGRSNFLSGKSTEWRASFDWLLAPTNFIKVVEGHYDNRSKA